MIISPEQLNQNIKILYERVDDFVKNEYYKFFKGFSIADGFLIIDIGDDKSIHINPNFDAIYLVDKRAYHNSNFQNEIGVATLNRLIVGAKLAAESYLFHRPKLVKWFDSQLDHKIGDTVIMYQKNEVCVYKMHLTFLISQTCLNSKGVYKFKLSGGAFLHLTNISFYWQDDGEYCLETGNGGAIVYYFEAEHPSKILNAIKDLYQNPERIRNLAQV